MGNLLRIKRLVVRVPKTEFDGSSRGDAWTHHQMEEADFIRFSLSGGGAAGRHNLHISYGLLFLGVGGGFQHGAFQNRRRQGMLPRPVQLQKNSGGKPEENNK